MPLFTSIGVGLGASAVVAAGATVSAATAVGIGATALAAGAVGYSMYSSDAQMKAGKRAATAMEQANMPMLPGVPKIKDATAIANKQATQHRQAMARSKSVKSNPLGLASEAKTIRKTLLGG